MWTWNIRNFVFEAQVDWYDLYFVVRTAFRKKPKDEKHFLMKLLSSLGTDRSIKTANETRPTAHVQVNLFYELPVSGQNNRTRRYCRMEGNVILQITNPVATAWTMCGPDTGTRTAGTPGPLLDLLSSLGLPFLLRFLLLLRFFLPKIKQDLLFFTVQRKIYNSEVRWH